jgi:hypothetical protein
MRRILSATLALAALAAIPTAASAQYYWGGDPYGRSPLFGYPPPPAARYVESPVYLAPGATYVAPGTAFQDQAIIINGQRYYRDCWWDWGQRKCELKPWW